MSLLLVKITINYFLLFILDTGAGIAEKLIATSFNEDSSFVNRVDVLDVTNKNSPSPTMEALMKALLSLSLIAGVSVVKEAW